MTPIVEPVHSELPSTQFLGAHHDDIDNYSYHNPKLNLEIN